MDIIRLGVKIAHPIFSLVKKILLVFLVFYTVISLFVYFFKTDTENINIKQQSLKEKEVIYEHINDPELKKTMEGQVRLGLYRGLMCGLVGEACTNIQADAPKYFDQSLFGRVTGWITAPYSVPPASGIAWVQNSFQEAGFIPSAYAAEGIGFSSIKGYIGIWKLFRNVAFLVLVLVMLIIGFLIMFRVKIDPQTVVSIESVLPRIVITMIYISLSFAIAGFLIDIMYTLIGVSISLIMGYGQGLDKSLIISTQDDMIGGKFHDLWPTGFGAQSPFGVGSALWDMIPLEFKAILDTLVISKLALFLTHTELMKWDPLLTAPDGASAGAGFVFEVQAGIGKLLSGPLRWILITVLSGYLTWVLPGLILGVIIIFTILLLMFKIFFILLSSYIKVILYVVFAPVIILMEAFPGQNSFMWWFKNLIGELIVFPTVVIIMLTGNAILRMNSNAEFWSLGSAYSSALKGNDTFVLPFLHGFNPDDFNMIVALGIILLIPDLIKIVKGWVGVEDMPLNLSLGTFLAGGTAIASGAMGGLGQFHTLQSTLVGQNPGHGLLHKYEGSSLGKAAIGFLGGKTSSGH